ncbi:MAG TPA: FAD:protein FMN transferase [Candidatus Limnocylindrales bacterium]
MERLMGTVVSIDVRGPGSPATDEAIDAVVGELRAIEQVFSPWLPDSEISRIADGRLAEADASPDVRFVLSACDHLAAVSGGAFDARRHRADGRLDPSGFVKGWAVEEAARHLNAAGRLDYAINAGGDILVRGDAEPGTGAGWRVGIRDPEDQARVVRVLKVRGLAVATSGRYERGDHIRDPRVEVPAAASRTAAASDTLASLTVVGPSLGWADAYATAGFVLGDRALGWIEDRAGYGGLAVTHDRRLAWTARVDPLLIPANSADDAELSRSSQPAALEYVS